ncbi:MAG: phosphate regulon transcriptional regulatory protein PhoB [gamma proteobacterium symbiont of Ctena orbiculata]|uniref:Phosphate regulon transcriptional regulatory protein PhoB n=1 Tax=Candidatus Thiodiazotropha taylori TaxID=2792791 RepID=A0A944QWC2_9GAMM|nr:phosphate regulon transcriptional regulator PhoB [Candidatus Thiodiazotropha taylori]PUB85570.1 MAG: phosphate regulon transcriptional regulatory protein PhoB [gamma proteobacterium symbiont of Ctena orbiculata]MBT3029347.1 phosphate regulon transcriptional regulator PhoB [Candidatus Thiodiazotropha taylori]MBT3037176.1 phosphate regulon transcriptional regulator PhoB [Candidatus Thiodiazotropha taylori]MBV2135291.1 phosphate regulon transcriptional regulator PhoB [Candidatus Thiodiazotropha
MTVPRILAVDDEPAVGEMLRFILEQDGFQADFVEDATQAINQIRKSKPDLILLDWMMPGMSGLELAGRLKKDRDTAGIPIIMLTAKGEEDDKVRGLDIGAEDYVTKPFSARELLARIRSILRRVSPLLAGDQLECGGLVLDPVSHRVTSDGEGVELGPTEFRLLHFFMSHRERVFTRGQLLDQVWGTNVYIEERTVDVHIRRLRKALEPTSKDKLLQTVRGAGYRFSDKF